jgi:hypothetical protein
MPDNKTAAFRGFLDQTGLTQIAEVPMSAQAG